jgi:hypothetical protein
MNPSFPFFFLFFLFFFFSLFLSSFSSSSAVLVRHGSDQRGPWADDAQGCVQRDCEWRLHHGPSLARILAARRRRVLQFMDHMRNGEANHGCWWCRYADGGASPSPWVPPADIGVNETLIWSDHAKGCCQPAMQCPGLICGLSSFFFNFTRYRATFDLPPAAAAARKASDAQPENLSVALYIPTMNKVC